jgi:U3 small nucleolar RNA-associated protein 10
MACQAISVRFLLVRRFSTTNRLYRPQDHNTECLILTFLPYHTEPLFLSLLTILPRQIPQTFRFLYPSITAVEVPKLHTIIYTATNNQAFFASFNHYILRVARARHQYSRLVSFWASVVTQAVDGMISGAQSGRKAVQRQRQEDLMLRVLPILNEGLSFLDIPELIVGCCIITTVLAAKGNLEDHILDSMMEAIATGWTPQTTETRVTCLGLLASGRSAAELSRPVIKKLLKFDDFPNQLISVSRKSGVDRLTLGYIMGCFKQLLRNETASVDLEVIENLIRADVLGKVELKAVMKNLLFTARKLHHSGGSTSEKQSSLASLVTFFAEWPSSRDMFQRVLDKSTVSQEELELSLETVIPRRIEATAVDEDVTMEEVQPNAAPSDFDANLATIAGIEPHTLSFLSPSMLEEFGLLYAVFLQALSSEDNLRRFIDTPAVNQNSPLAFLSFYVRIFAGNCPQMAKCAALRVLTRALKDEETKNIDFQAIVPYLIVSLMDKLAKVRQAAAECTLALSQYNGAGADHESNTPVLVVLGDENASSKALDDPQSVSKCVMELVQKVLVPELEECIIDADTISNVLFTALNGSSHTSKPILKASTTELKTSERATIVAFLAGHAVSSPLLYVAIRLFTIINPLGKISSTTRTQLLIPSLKQWLALTQDQLSRFSLDPRVSISEMDTEFFKVITSNEQDGVHLLRELVAGEVIVPRDDALQAAHQRLKEIWSSMKPGNRELLALVLLLTAVPGIAESSSAKQSDLAIETIRSLTLPTDVLVVLVESLPNALEKADAPPAAKKRRTSRNRLQRAIPIDTAKLTMALRKYTLVLELVDNSTPENHPSLLMVLFHTLEQVHTYGAMAQSGMVYLQSLAINSLLAIVNNSKVRTLHVNFM